MGHSTIQITMDIYTHLEQEEMNKAAANLNNLIAPKLKRQPAGSAQSSKLIGNGLVIKDSTTMVQ